MASVVRPSLTVVTYRRLINDILAEEARLRDNRDCAKTDATRFLHDNNEQQADGKPARECSERADTAESASAPVGNVVTDF